MKTTPVSASRAIGIIRVSEVGGRSGDSFVSPTDQRNRIVASCNLNALDLLDVYEELDVSAGSPLHKRPGLSAAIERVERGEANVIVVAYFDRLVRSLKVQSEILERVEAAGGSILAVDVGTIRTDTASHWLSSTMLGMVAEYHRRMTAERIAAAHDRCVRDGVAAWRAILPGYRRGADGRIEVHPEEAETMREAFALRAAGMSVLDLETWLADRGVVRSANCITRALQSRFYLGEIHFGHRSNLESHPAIVDADLWAAVQRRNGVPHARGPKSEQLLAHTGILRCAACGSALVVRYQVQRGTKYASYGHMRGTETTRQCSARVSISAPVAESIIVERVRELLADVEASASASEDLQTARARLHRAQAQLDHAIDILADLGDVASAKAKLAALRAEVDAATEAVADLEERSGTLRLNGSTDWDALSLDGRRALLRAVLRKVDVLPATGAGRTTDAQARARLRIDAALE